MAYYEHEFMGIPARGLDPRGLDPNFQESYYGMRMRGGEGQASYGMHRLRHAEDLGGEGGFPGRYGKAYRRLPRGFDPDWQTSGGVRDPRYDREYLRDYNARSGRFREPSRSQPDRNSDRGALPVRESPRVQRSGDDRDFANRGLSSSGYSQGWISRRGGRR